MNPEALFAHLHAVCEALDQGRPLPRPAGMAFAGLALLGCQHTHTEYATGLYGAPMQEVHQEVTLPEIMAEPVVLTEHCSDGLDNDGDGQVDCDDPDCTCAADVQEQIPVPEVAEQPPLPAEHCSDGVDNDGDKQVDCDDPDCACGAMVLYAAP